MYEDVAFVSEENLNRIVPQLPYFIKTAERNTFCNTYCKKYCTDTSGRIKKMP